MLISEIAKILKNHQIDINIENNKYQIVHQGKIIKNVCSFDELNTALKQIIKKEQE